MGQFELLPPSAQADAVAASVIRIYKRNHVVFHAGDPAGSVHVVRTGTFAVQMASANGTNTIVAVLGPGEVFGETAVIRQGYTRTATVLALEPSSTLMIPAQAFNEIRAKHPIVDRLMIELLADRLETMGRRLCEAYGEDVLHRCLLRLAELTITSKDKPAALAITQEQLAELVGTTRPSVNQALHRLQERGLVSLSRGKITVSDPADLQLAVRR